MSTLDYGGGADMRRSSRPVGLVVDLGGHAIVDFDAYERAYSHHYFLTELRGLTMLDPFGGLVAAGLKPIETRWYSTKYRGPIAFTASKGKALALEERFHDRYIESGVGNVLLEPGTVICTAYLVDCRPMRLEDQDDAWIGYDPKRWAWVLRDVRPVSGVRIRGMQSLFRVSRDVADRVYAQVAVKKAAAP